MSTPIPRCVAIRRGVGRVRASPNSNTTALRRDGISLLLSVLDDRSLDVGHRLLPTLLPVNSFAGLHAEPAVQIGHPGTPLEATPNGLCGGAKHRADALSIQDG